MADNMRRYNIIVLSPIVLINSIIYLLLFINHQKALSINRALLDINGTYPYLINITNGKFIEPRDYMNFDNIYAPSEFYKQQQTAQGRNYYFLKAFDFANYYQTDHWHYSNEHDLLVSGHPVANEHKCSQQLEWLEQQLNISSEILFQRGEEHVNLMSLMDAFGRPAAGTYLGHGHWLGSYYECLRVNINIQKFELEKCRASQNYSPNDDKCRRLVLESQNSNETAVPKEDATSSFARKQEAAELKARYCIGKARDIDWPSEQEDNYVPRISYKIGLCLPETCDTLSFRRHKNLIERLMLYNMPEYMRTRLTLNDIYCLPDNRSPIRELSFSARIFLGLCISWLLLLIAATWLHSHHRSQQKDINLFVEQRSPDSRLDMNKLQQQVELKLSESRWSMTNTSNGHKSPNFGNNNGGSTITPAVLKLSSSKYLTNSTEQTQQNGHNNPTGAISNGTQLSVIKSTQGLTTAKNTNVPPINTTTTTTTTTTLETNGQAHRELLFVGPTQTVHLTEVEVVADDGNELDNHLELYNQSRTSRTRSSSPSSCSHYSSASSASSSGSSIIISGWLNECPLLIKILRALSISRNMIEFQTAPLLLCQPEANEKLRINLNALDFIKCLCCILVIFGHTVFIHMQHLANIIQAIELSYQLVPRILISFFNFVDTFFIISGMLTAYFIFKRFNKKTFANPLVWLSIAFLRLARLTPVYLLTFWFVKTLVVYLADGPLWDYGTDKNSIKGLCINDYWWKSILYLGNWNTMQPLCILPAWSIIIDSQYSIILPPILFIIFKSKRLGYLGLLVATAISTTNMSIQLANSTAVKTSDMSKIRLHVYPLISRFATDFYNAAWNRIAPVAIGVFGGHMLYLYEINKINRWPWFMRGLAFKFVLLMHVFIFMLPSLGLLTDPPESNQTADMTIFIVSNATIKPLWAIINTIFLLRLLTDLRKVSLIARLISHNIWHCLGKLCFACYLIHYEIILILLKSRKDNFPDVTWTSVIREFSVVFVISTVVSYFIYILFEAPINKLLMLCITKPNYHKLPKTTTTDSNKITVNQKQLKKLEEEFSNNIKVN